MELLNYATVFVAITIIVLGAVYFKKKFKLIDEDFLFIQDVLHILKYIVGKFALDNQDLIKEIINDCLTIIPTIIEYDQIIDEQLKKELLKEVALNTCRTKGITIDDELVEIVDVIVDYVYKHMEQKKIG